MYSCIDIRRFVSSPLLDRSKQFTPAQNKNIQSKKINISFKMEKNVYDDCWQLIQSFGRVAAESQNASFELFCKCWHQMQMQHIYSAQTNHIEVIGTTLAALHVGKRIACSRRTNGEPFQATRSQRFGAIYLLYAIYNKQPTKHFVKIEVSPDTWDSLSKYAEQLHHKEPQRRDTQQMCHIFRQLVQENAFRYTALDYCHALDALAAYDSLESLAVSKQKNNTALIMKQQLTSGNSFLHDELHELTELASVCKPLCQLEDSYNKQMAPHRSSFAPTKIFSQLNDLFYDINKLLIDEERTSTSTNTNSDANNQLEVRQRVRNKAMFGETIVKLSSEEETEEPSTMQPKKPHERRMSSATVFERRLPEDVIRDLEG